MTEINKKYYLVYQIENKLNNMIYIGCHITTNINDKYMGSGTRIKRAIKKYGLDNFNKSILYCFDNEQEMLDKEAELVNKEFIARLDTYNIIIGGNQFLSYDCVVVKDKNGNNIMINKNDPEYLSGALKHICKDKAVVKDKDGKQFSIDINDPRYLSGEFVSIYKDIIIVCDKDGNNISINRNDPRYLSGEFVSIWKDRKHTEETKKKIGKANSIRQKGENNSQFGTCWITKDSENKKIKKEELELYLNLGWKKGRKQKRE